MLDRGLGQADGDGFVLSSNALPPKESVLSVPHLSPMEMNVKQRLECSAEEPRGFLSIPSDESCCNLRDEDSDDLSPTALAFSCSVSGLREKQLFLNSFLCDPYMTLVGLLESGDSRKNFDDSG